MNKYEMSIKISQIQRLVEERKYKKAAAVLETIDVRQIRSQGDLNTVAEVYVKTEQFEAAKAIYLKLYKKRRTKRILYRLIYLAIRTNVLDEAEDFYEEFLNLSHSNRDNLILRYRIDKAKGVPIGQLIETLEQLKDEEYIEEWAYELAKLYQRAGRNEECRRECEDIILWFGQGEIVERADMLLDYLDGDPQLYYQDKDYTVKEEEPNPDDTGSLPDLTEEMIKQEAEKLKQKKKEEKKKRKQEEYEEDEELEEESGIDAAELAQMAQMAKEGLMKLTGFWKRSEKTSSDKESEEESPSQTEPENHIGAENETEAENERETENQPELLAQTQRSETAEIPADPEAAGTQEDESQEKEETEEETYSQSGLGITQDLAKEISAIVEAEKREQLKERAVELLHEMPERMEEASNVAVSVIDRMAHAMQNKTGKQYIPLDVTETEEVAQPELQERVEKPEGMEEITPEVVEQREEEVTMIELDQIMPEPDIPELKQVIPEDSPELGNQPALEEKDLPTTKALHHSFDDMLTLIAGEREPKHFVLMGEGEERILGITKKIVRVMNLKGFLSTKQIAKIHAQQLNEMDLLRVCNQIKGSCLLIDGAAQLLFPTITKIFAVMDAFHGDFMVVLADEGNTLDELFRVAPALARRFEYVIDISQYNEEDYL